MAQGEHHHQLRTREEYYEQETDEELLNTLWLGVQNETSTQETKFEMARREMPCMAAEGGSSRAWNREST